MAKYKQTTFFRQYGENKSITLLCGAIVFKNSGDVAVDINKTWRLEPGDETPTISTGHPDVVDETEYTIAFDPTSAGTIKLVNVIYTQIKPVDPKGKAGACDNF